MSDPNKPVNLAARAAVSVMGREPAITEALGKFLSALQWLDAVSEIDYSDDIALLVDGKFRVRFCDAAGAPQEFLLPSSAAYREAWRKQQEKADQQAAKEIADGKS